jgi:translation elongation factor EF-4
MHSIFGIEPADVLHISAKTGHGISAVLRAIVERIPPPPEDTSGSLKAILFDSSSVTFVFYIGGCSSHNSRYDRYRGVISLVSIQGGVLRKGTIFFTIRVGSNPIFQRGQNSILSYPKKV